MQLKVKRFFYCAGILTAVTFFPKQIFATEALTELLRSFNLSNDGFYNKVLSPAKTTDTSKSSSQRIEDANKKIQSELSEIVRVFDSSKEDEKQKNIKALLQNFDSGLANKNTNIVFVNTEPSSAITRTVLMIKKDSSNSLINPQQLLRTFTSYKRAAVPSSYVYEYSDPRNIAQSQIMELVGNADTWRKSLAPPAMQKDREHVLKKCRQIFGWKCVTSLYRTGEVQIDRGHVSYLFAGIYDLKNNPDHSIFARDKRSSNQIDGSTALYVVKESSEWVILMGIDLQWNEDKLTFTTLIMDELQKDFLRIKERIAEDLKIKTTDIK